MSMFYELMMRKKEQIMYATIKGTLTENDGVFSGFSDSNYLKLQQFLDYNSASSWEIKLTFTTGNDVNTIQALYHDSWNSGGVYISIGTNRIRPYLNFGDEYIYGYPSGTILTNTKYYCRLMFTGTQYKILLSTDNHIWNEYYSLTDNRKVASQTSSYGRLGDSNRFNNHAFLGSIDLPNSYIKLGSTKYNLQAVVGYTIVGSPTIVDGVVSGFSSANYLKINVPTAINYNVFELNIKFKTSDSSVYQRLVWNSNNLLFIITSGVISFNFYNTSNNWTSRGGGAIQNNTWYWYKIKFDIVNKTMIADRSTDGINFTNVLSSQNISNIYSNIKITTNGIIFCDQDNSSNITLDLNNNNIKINNKLWFNGQPS